jgi:hypothetical protein
MFSLVIRERNVCTRGDAVHVIEAPVAKVSVRTYKDAHNLNKFIMKKERKVEVRKMNRELTLHSSVSRNSSKGKMLRKLKLK